MTTTPPLLTLREAANRLGIGMSTLYKVIAKGDLPVVKIGKSTRVRESDLTEYVAGRVVTRSPRDGAA